MRWLLLVALMGCGSKTGLPLGGRSVSDAGVDATAPDGGFDTFPCRWSYQNEAVVFRGLATTISGAVHPSGPTAFIAADGQVVRVTLRSTPVVDWMQPIGAGEVFATDDGFGLLDRDRCELSSHDFDGNPTASTRVVRGECEPSGAFEGSLAVAESVRRGFDVSVLDVASGEVSRFGRFAETGFTNDGITLARDAVFFPSQTTEPAVLGPRAVGVLSGDGSTRIVPTPDGSTWYGLAPNRLRGGAVALWAGRRGTELAAISSDGEVTSIDVSSLPFPALQARAPLRSLVTNETEAIFLLVDGTFVHAPLSGTPVRFLDEPFDPSGAPPFNDQAAVLLVDGGSAGGVLYAALDATGAPELRFRAMVCNR